MGQNQSFDLFSGLPDELVLEVYRRLPTSSSHRSLRRTSRRFDRVGRDESLRQLFYRHLCKEQSGDPNEFEVYVAGTQRDYERDYKRGVFYKAFGEEYWIVKNLVESSGSDRLELGVPYSDEPYVPLLPPEIGTVRCRDLRVYYMSLMEMHENIGNATQLEVLKFHAFAGNRLPGSIGKLVNLRNLSVGFASFDLSDVRTLTKLERLKGNVDRLDEDLGRFPNLQKLFIHDSELKEIPPSVASLTDLSYLKLYGVPLTRLPSQLFELPNLSRVDLRHTGLGELPEDIGNLTGLMWLTIAHQEFRRLPESLGRLQRLSILELWDIPLVQLPESFGNLGALSVFSVIDLELGGLPDSLLDLPVLEVLALDRSYGSDDLVEELREVGVDVREAKERL